MYEKLLPKRVKNLRAERGMTRRYLAVAAGISVTTARNAERGEPVRSKTASRVARALGVEPPQRLSRPARRA